MSSNSAAFRGGAVAVGGNTSLAAATMTLANCVLISNIASSSGAALFVDKGGNVDLVNSVFQSNGNDTDDGVGVVSFNGRVQCDATFGCLPVCTVCQDDEVPSPTVQVTMTPTYDATPEKLKPGRDGSVASTFFYLALSTLGLLASVVIYFVCLVYRSRFEPGRNDQNEDGNNEGVEINLIHSPQMHAEVIYAEVEEPENQASLPWSAIESSPAPIFAMDREMRIVAWSPGSCTTLLMWCRSPATASLIYWGHLLVCTFKQGWRSLSRWLRIHAIGFSARFPS